MRKSVTRCKSLAAVIMLLTQLLIIGTFAAGSGVIEVEITDVDGEALSGAVIGDIIKVSVYLTDFEALSMTCPSLHFNPEAARVSDRYGNILETQYASKSAFETDIGGVGGSWKGTVMMTESYYPFINNETGVIGFWADSGSNRDLSGRQRIYSVYMTIVGAGDTEIRLSRREDGAGRDDPGKYYDYALYSGDTPCYVRYGSGESEEPEHSYTASISPLKVSELSVYFKAKRGGAAISGAAVGDSYDIEVYINGARNAENITLPVERKPQGLAVLNGVTAASGFELAHNGQYSANSEDIMLEASASGGVGVDLNGAERLLCTLNYTAVGSGAIDYGFAASTDRAPVGVVLYDNAEYDSPAGNRPLFPNTGSLRLEITAAAVPTETPGGGGGGGGAETSPEPSAAPAVTRFVSLLNKEDHYRYVYGYPDGTIQPDGKITREEVAAIFYRLMTSEARGANREGEPDFPDVSVERWSAVSIGTMRKAGIIEGYPDGTFKPGQTVTRAEFAVIAMRFDELVPGALNKFGDLIGHWAEAYVSSSVSKGWVDGYPDGTFRPEQAITRAEAMKLINRVLERKVDGAGLLESLTAEWTDVSAEHWGWYEIQEATVSHNYVRRYPESEDKVENWTGARADIEFD
jgi:hypothetical protein